ncbi:MAG: MoaD/ThiS family protein [Desulfurococcaceae archaeon]
MKSEKVKLTIKFYGSSYHIVGQKELNLEFNEKPSFTDILKTICSLTQSYELCTLFQSYPYPSRYLILLNGRPIYELEHLKLKNGDEITIVDIVSGG